MVDRMFPLHLALSNDAPDAVILAILAAYPEAAREEVLVNVYGLFLEHARSLHFAVTHARSLEVITAIVEAYPRAVCDLVKTNNGSMRRAVCIARENHAPEEMIAAVDPVAVMPQFLLTANLENDPDLLTKVQQPLKSLEKSAAITAAREMTQAAFLRSCLHDFIQGVRTTIKSIVEPDACGNLHLHTVLFQRAPAKTVLEVLDFNRNAAKEYTNDNRLALHIALENDAGATTIRALLEAFPAAASVGLPNNACGYGLTYSLTNDCWIELDRGIEKRCSRRRPYAVRDDLPDQLPFYWALQHRANADVLAALAEFHPVDTVASRVDATSTCRRHCGAHVRVSRIRLCHRQRRFNTLTQGSRGCASWCRRCRGTQVPSCRWCPRSERKHGPPPRDAEPFGSPISRANTDVQ
eukprot:m.468938 g.468938  ORF g.468938 m.468938 type:complete len:410 (-) comp27975_c0_seq1:2891-4120(-)